jgi:hypothetical protein
MVGNKACRGRAIGIAVTTALALLMANGAGALSNDGGGSWQYYKDITNPDNFSFMEVPDPLSGINPAYPLIEMEIPAVGHSFFDSRFGTVLTRTTEIDGIRGRHEYSRFDPFNKDKSMIILMGLGGTQDVYRTSSYPYNNASNLVLVRTIDLAEPRWDPEDINLIWGTNGYRSSIETINVSNGQTTIIKNFSQDPGLSSIIANEGVYLTMKDEGESSLDKRYWAFFLQGNASADYKHKYIFTWDRNTDTVLGLYKIASNETELDWVGMSPLGNWVLIGGLEYNGGNLTGLTMANKELTIFHRLDYTISHADVGLDIEGKEVIVMQNTRTDYIDLIPISLNTQPILVNGGSYENTNRTPFVRLFYSSSPYGFQSGVHISCNVPGYCVISTYIEPGLKEQNWLDRSIILIKLDRQNPRAFYLAKVYGTTGAYWEETHAAITNDGSRVVWASNWNQSIGEEKVFLMQLDMPPDWEELIDVTPPNVTNAAANQSDIPDDTDNIPLWGETARLNVTVTDDSGVASVTVNLSEIGGYAAKPMLNIGDNIYSTATNASAGTPSRLYNLTVNATDIYGNSNTSVRIQLRVMKNGDTTGNGVVNIGDALRLANNVSYPGNPAYVLSSPYVAEVTGNGVINIGDALRLANNVSYPGNLNYILK